MARRREGEGDPLEAILDARDDAPPARQRRRWVGRPAAVALALLAGVAGWLLAPRGGEGGDRAATPWNVGALVTQGRRVTGEGVAVRTFFPRDPDCRDDVGLVLELSDDVMIGAGAVGAGAAAVTRPTSIGGWGVVGTVEGSPVVWVAVHVPAEARRVELVVEGTVRDAAAPEEQWAVLAVRANAAKVAAMAVLVRGSRGEQLAVSGVEGDEPPEVPPPARCDDPGTG